MEKQPKATSQGIPVQQIKLTDLHLNKGQIKDVPKNPRFIKDARYEALKKSIEDDPEMLELRELVAYDNGGGELVVIMGNMRFRAMKELGYKEAPVKILPTDTAAKKLRAYIQKDNIAFGSNDWDAMANEWDALELKDFGLECDFLDSALFDDADSFNDLEEHAVKKEANDKSEFFEVTFLFPKQDEGTIKAYIKEVGKDNITEMVRKLALGQTENGE